MYAIYPHTPTTAAMNTSQTMIVMEERVDAHMLDLIAASDNTPSDQKKLAIQYRSKGLLVDGMRIVKVPYKRAAGGLPIGRAFAVGKQGLQGFPRAMRGALARKYYHDIDVENAHPTMLWQLCAKHGLPNTKTMYYASNRNAMLMEIMAYYSIDRDEAKTMFLKIMYGGSADAPHTTIVEEADAATVSISDKQPHPFLLELKAEVEEVAMWAWQQPQYAPIVEHVKGLKKAGFKTQRSKMASALAYILQTEENRVLAAMHSFFSGSKWPMDVLIHDGGCVRKSHEDEETVPPETLLACEAHVAQATGYRVHLAHKPFDTSISAEALEDACSNYTLEAEDVVVDDFYGAKRLVSFFPDRIKYCKDKLLVYDEDMGTWAADTKCEYVLRKMTSRLGKHMIVMQFMCQEANGKEVAVREVITNFSGNEARFRSMTKWLTAVPGVHDDGFVQRMENTAFAHLLFSNGILNLATGNFHAGFDPNIFFYHGQGIPRPYVGRPSEVVMRQVEHVLFMEPFNGDYKTAKYLQMALGRALAGDYRAKAMYFCVGNTNAGKGVLCGAMIAALGLGLVANFNGDQLVRNKNNGQDSAKSRSGIMCFANTRMAFSNEMQMDSPLDGNYIKSLTGGGDFIKARGNYQDEQDIVVKATMFCMVNDIPSIQPFDNAMQGRANCVEFPCTFVKDRDPQGPNEKRADLGIKDKFGQDDAWKDAVIHLLMDSYQAFLKEGVHAVPETVKTATASWLVTDNSLAGVLEKVGLEVTKDPTDQMTPSEIHALVANKSKGGISISMTKMGRELRQLGLTNGDGRPCDPETGKKGPTKRFWFGIRRRSCAYSAFDL